MQIIINTVTFVLMTILLPFLLIVVSIISCFAACGVVLSLMFRAISNMPAMENMQIVVNMVSLILMTAFLPLFLIVASIAGCFASCGAVLFLMFNMMQTLINGEELEEEDYE